MTSGRTPDDGLLKDSPFPVRESGIGMGLRHYERTDSTNARARDWANHGARHGSIVLADYQTSGRGRFDRSWSSNPGQNLLMTVILRVNLPRPALLPLATAMAVLTSLKKVHAPLSLEVKWPNDVLIDGKKCAGILVESPEENLYLVGIGVNINQDSFPSVVPRGDRSGPTSLLLESGLRFDRREMYSELLGQMETVMQSMLEPDFIQAYSRLLRGVGEKISLSTGHQGVFVGLSEDGGLILESDAGRDVFFAGDVSLREQ